MQQRILTFGLSLLLLMAAMVVVQPAVPDAQAQQRDWEVHSRGLLHQSVFNTGELGRPYSAGGTVVEGRPSLEWPPNSRIILNRQNFPGYHNSFGSGLWISATRNGERFFSFGGAVSNTDGDPVPVVGVHSSPRDVERITNYPIREDGSLNSAWDPNEAEEVIISEWDTPTGIRVTRTSRAWSYPGYDSFIIYEYELENTTDQTLTDVFVTFANTFGPSMFGYQRNHGEWTEAAFRGQPPAGLGDHFARYDLKRFMSYNHEREGLPDPELFDQWSQPGDRGGLNAPQAAGIMVLHYDYEHLATRDETEQVFFVPSDSTGMWDENGKAKQPFLLRYENGNLYDGKIATWMDPQLPRKTSIWGSGAQDSTRFVDQFEPELWDYWKGRSSTSANLSWWQPVSRAYGFHPYTLPPGEALRFTVAEVVGYGPGIPGDEQYTDLGGAVRSGVDAGALFNPIPSWYETISYPFLGTKDYIGSEYLQDNPLPWYVSEPVVSIRDVADRAIQMYTGDTLVKYDSLQYRPEDAPATGAYDTVPIPIPAPAISIENTAAASNLITWGPEVENFMTPRMNAGFDHYEVLRAPHPLGPWTVVAEVMAGDSRYFENGRYSVLDPDSNLGDAVAYAVRSVDAEGHKSGWTNLTVHQTQAPPAERLGEVYVIPNPLVVTSGLSGSDSGGDISDRLQFMGLTSSCTIRIFSYTGQLINTIEHEEDSFGDPWYQLTTNNQIIASGVYYFVVEDHATGERANGKFVVIH